MVNLVVYIKNAPEGLLFGVDEVILEQLLHRLDKVAKRTKTKYTIDVGSLLSLPDIVQPARADEKSAQQIKAIVLELARKAIASVRQMRAAEGKALQEDLERHCAELRRKLTLIKGRGEMVLRDYANRLKKRADELLSKSEVKMDEQTVAREVAVYAERSDISEEIDRLDSHIQQFVDTCRATAAGSPENPAEQAGRRLDFICQEMLREANTIASKAADSQIIHTIVDVKCLIDRIKEQVQNVE